MVAGGVTYDLARDSRAGSSASAWIGAGIVAENNSVCRCARELRDDPAHVGDEAEVEHVVGLVEHEHLDASKLREPLAHQVDEAARAGDEHVDAARAAPRPAASWPTPPWTSATESSRPAP